MAITPRPDLGGVPVEELCEALAAYRLTAATLLQRFGPNLGTAEAGMWATLFWSAESRIGQPTPSPVGQDREGLRAIFEEALNHRRNGTPPKPSRSAGGRVVTAPADLYQLRAEWLERAIMAAMLPGADTLRILDSAIQAVNERLPIPAPEEPKAPRNSCNRHSDCRAANERQLERHNGREAERELARRNGETRYWKMPVPLPRLADHCFDEGCSDCFGN